MHWLCNELLGRRGSEMGSLQGKNRGGEAFRLIKQCASIQECDIDDIGISKELCSPRLSASTSCIRAQLTEIAVQDT